MTNSSRFLEYQNRINEALDCAIPETDVLYSKIFTAMLTPSFINFY